MSLLPVPKAVADCGRITVRVPLSLRKFQLKIVFVVGATVSPGCSFRPSTTASFLFQKLAVLKRPLKAFAVVFGALLVDDSSAGGVAVVGAGSDVGSSAGAVVVGAGSSEVGASDVGASGVGSSEVGASGVGSSGVGQASAGSVNVFPSAFLSTTLTFSVVSKEEPSALVTLTAMFWLPVPKEIAASGRMRIRLQPLVRKRHLLRARRSAVASTLSPGSSTSPSTTASSTSQKLVVV